MRPCGVCKLMPHHRPFFSIITISFNAEKVIGPTLQSVVDQQGVEGLLEHWVVDGASRDGTLDVVRQFPHVRYLCEPDKGISDAFNKGMHLATGEYILYLNCDDIFYDERVLANLYQFAVEHNRPDWIVGRWYARRLNGAVELVKPKPPVAEWNLFLGPRICHQAVLLKLDAQRAIGGFDLDFKLAMDYDSWAKLYQAGYRITNFNRPLVIYADGGHSTRNDALAERDHKAVKARLRDRWWKRLVGALYDQVKGSRKVHNATLSL
jgi:glycosyltransferase involved in cell wall biosynthesis